MKCLVVNATVPANIPPRQLLFDDASGVKILTREYHGLMDQPEHPNLSTLRRYANEAELSLQPGSEYAALALALAMPDICVLLESKDQRTTPESLRLMVREISRCVEGETEK
jgi:hypothetical protein